MKQKASRVCGHFEKRLDFILRAIRFPIPLTHLANFFSIFRRFLSAEKPRESFRAGDALLHPPESEFWRCCGLFFGAHFFPRGCFPRQDFCSFSVSALYSSAQRPSSLWVRCCAPA